VSELRETYYRVSPSVWREFRVDDERVMALYLLTCEHRTTEGLFLLPLGYVSADLGWTDRRTRKAFAAVEAAGMVRYDADVSVCFIAKALKQQSPANPNQVKSALKKLVALPPTPLFDALLASAREHAKPFSLALVQAFPERFGEPLGEPLAEPSPDRSAEPSRRPSPQPSPEHSTSTSSSTSTSTGASAQRHPADPRPEVVRLSRSLHDALRDRDPQTKGDPGSPRWLGAIRLLLDEDGRTVEQVELVLAWLARGDTKDSAFWQANVLSTAALRDRFPKLVACIQREEKTARPAHGAAYLDELAAMRRRAIEEEARGAA